MRKEQDIFDDLTQLCSSPGYAHAIAYLCFRDNTVGYAEEMKAEDMQHLFSMTRLIRTEISTLIGLLIKEEVDYALSASSVMQQYLDKTEALLEELHNSMSAPMFDGLDPKKVAEEGSNPFTSGEALREPIFYGGESAYSFQYRDLSPKKYANDDEWLEANKGFSIRTARDVVYAVQTVQNERLIATLKALKKLDCKEDGRLKVINEVIELPRADLAQRIIAMETEQQRLLRSFRGTYLNLKSFLPLAVKYKLSSEFPSYDSYGYLHEKAMGRDHLNKLDANNRRNIQQYIRNIHTMEHLTRLNTNLALLRKHQADLVDSGKRTIDVVLVGLRIGDFVLTTFPGELTVRIGLNIKKASPHDMTFVAGYTNGYIYYSPTAEQLRNVGGAQEDSDCLLAPEWQKLYEEKVAELLGKL
ncbi:MAG: hypothetical protein IIA09_19105 [Proteobacteria bacterium]|nr:hypothetical protein [Pseudomonadota bacterium]